MWAPYPCQRESSRAQRNTIERGFGRLKQWRGIASRYDKYALVFLGGVLLAAILQYRH
jgi:putative transposase